MGKILIKKFKESVVAVFPITVIVLLIGIVMGIMPIYSVINFIFGSILLILGMSLFTMGSEISIMTIGEKIGSYITRKKKIFLILLVAFIIGTIITVAEPDVSVLANQVTSVNPYVLTIVLGVGAGLFLLLGTLRILYNIKISYILFISYLIVGVVACAVPDAYISLAFDSGGVTTGAMSVSFIIALGIGIASIRSSKDAKEDSFGLIGICSIGPVFAVLLLGLLNGTSELASEPFMSSNVESILGVIKQYIIAIPNYFYEVALVLFPILLVFFVFQKFFLKIRKRPLKKILKGLVYTYLGLVLFLTGVNVGFLPVGYLFGSNIASSDMNYLLIPIGMLIGYVVVVAEPAVVILVEQVEEITQGNIKKKVMKTALSIGVALSIAIAMIRVMEGIPIWYFLLPIYFIAVVLSFIIPSIFTSIAFDSGGIASGTMTAAFILPFAIGASTAMGGNVASDAFGVVAIASAVPIVTVQFIGLIYMIKLKRIEKNRVMYDEEIIDYEGDSYE